MYLQKESFSISLKENMLEFSGKIELSDYRELTDFLKETEKKVGENKMVLNLKKLDFLNSSGIRAIAVFILETKNIVDIIIDETRTWQKVGISPIMNMKKQGQINIKN